MIGTTLDFLKCLQYTRCLTTLINMKTLFFITQIFVTPSCFPGKVLSILWSIRSSCSLVFSNYSSAELSSLSPIVLLFYTYQCLPPVCVALSLAYMLLSSTTFCCFRILSVLHICVLPLISPLNKYLLRTYYVLASVIGNVNIPIQKSDWDFLCGIYILMRKVRLKAITKWRNTIMT